MTPAEPPLGRGSELAPGYEVIAHMRRGRSLDVYDAWSHERAARCIVKAIRPERLHHERTRLALLEEGRRLEQLSHPHIVRGYETLAVPRPLVVMETLGGATLGYEIGHRRTPLAAELVARLGVQLGSAVRYLHAHEILHLDLKPANLVVEDGRLKVIDLSVAHPPGQVPAGVGTWCYLAPEQAVDGPVGSPADVWGIGAVLFEAATGEPAFDYPEDEEGSYENGTSEGDPEGDEPAFDDPESDSDYSWLDTDGGPYPQVAGRAARVDDLTAAPKPFADLVAACLEPDPTLRPTVPELLAELEPISDLPAQERRWRAALNAG